MVEHFDDPIATSEAQALACKKYLVYLDHGIDLPFPTNRWFRFEVSLIGTTLRPEDRAKGITSDMAIPIYPNDTHPTSRSPLYPEKPFPFPNCYHWIETMARIRIRRKPEQYDETNAISLSARQHVMIDELFAEDYQRIEAFERNELATIMEDELTDSAATAAPDNRRLPPVTLHPGSSTTADSCLSAPSTYLPPYSVGEGHDGGEYSNASLRDPPKYDPTVQMLFDMDIFNLSHDENAEFLPLVDLWFELDEHLTPDTIPNPLEFYSERDVIARIIRDARIRRPKVPTPSRNDDRMSIGSDDSDSQADQHQNHHDARDFQQGCCEDAADSEHADTEPPPGRHADPVLHENLPQYRSNVTPSELLRTRANVLWLRWTGPSQEKPRGSIRHVPWKRRPPFLPYWP